MTDDRRQMTEVGMWKWEVGMRNSDVGLAVVQNARTMARRTRIEMSLRTVSF
ncbi:MAG: hypothetical protein GY850_45525 [bacterium]|nr:hypothetical protein [bacterium]